MNNQTNISFDDIVKELECPLMRYLQKMVGNSQEAEDLLQETYVRINKNLNKLEDREKLKSWAFRIATNVAIDALRKKKNKEFLEFDESREPDTFNESDKVVIHEMNDCIRRVIDELPPDYRAAVLLHDLQDLSIKDTAEICDVSTGATKVRIHRARIKLKEALEQKCNFYQSDDGHLRCEEKTCSSDACDE